MTALLDVGVLHARDVPGAQEGGADRLWLATEAGMSPDLQVVSSVLKETDLPVRVMLRLNDSHTTTGGEFTRLGGLAEEYLSLVEANPSSSPNRQETVRGNEALRGQSELQHD